MPARRWAAVVTATALAAGPAALAGAGSAHATEGHGSASAAVLRTGLDVSLLNKTVHAPLAVTLNEVHAPRSARKTALTAALDGVDGGKPFSVLRAEVADAEATVNGDRAEASTTLAKARLHVPGLPLLPVVELEAVSSRAVCGAGEVPHASVTLPAAVTVLGKRVALTAEGPTHVEVPGVGSVRLDLSKTGTTSTTAAATALRLEVSVNPLKLNVAEVDGTLTLAEAACEAPAGAAAEPAPAEAGEAAADAPAGVQPQGARAEQAAPAADLAETGGDSTTPYIAAGAVALLGAGGAAVLLSRRGRRS
ncbi:LPXTG cell wall anchor domain-containing protein [Streptomyces sp. CHD11]|uniref:SCO1860 family LAETG-anchored protein n=1 Tax=Streptomyces sp. CHD11 TaxID=2741325 RepID=UPI001BFC27B2|nr:SCO1860 family LAETG-anchored protein [Streptomyces sp. CHD11]MBT3150634.1 LPXTG cell wall anchor domain-containing protein [Streptomyces sp. CHD11]